MLGVSMSLLFCAKVFVEVTNVSIVEKFATDMGTWTWCEINEGQPVV